MRWEGSLLEKQLLEPVKLNASLKTSLFTSLTALFGLLGITNPVLADYSKVCGLNNGYYVAEFKLDINGYSSGWNAGTAAGQEKCYTAKDVFGQNPLPEKMTFTLKAKAQGGETTTCRPDNQPFSTSVNKTANFKSAGTTANVTCQMKQ